MLSFRQGLFTLGSVCVSSAVIGNAYLQKGQFYPSVVFLTKSNPCMAVIYVQAAVIVWLMAKAMGKLFFGQLRPAELEHLLERSWYAVTETCLAFTVFRDDFSPKFVALFVLLLVLKGFHWLAEERVDFMERSPNISLIFHVRVLSLLAILSVLDYAFVLHAYYSVTTAGASVQMVFGFEYAILLSSVLYIFIKYVLHSIDSRAETQWENKAVFLLYTELMMSASKVVLYATFMMVMLRIHTFPLFAIRPMYLSIRALKRAFKDVILSRQAIHNMNTLYPDATAEELVSADNVCIICREEMSGPGNKKLPCNHIFHAACLRSWFQRQQTCPTCRSDVLNVSRQTNQRAGNQRAQVPQNNQNLAGIANLNINGNPNQINLQNLQPFFNWPFVNPLQQQQQQQQQQQPPNQAANQQQNPQQPGPNNDGTQQHPQQQQRQANGQGGAANMGRPGPSQSATIPPPPPFLLLPPVFVPPPPPIIPSGLNLTALSDDELRAMEGNERRAVEARVQNLRNIQTLIDAAVTMMGHYNTAWANAQPPTTNATTNTEPPQSSSSSSSSSTATPDSTQDNTATSSSQPPSSSTLPSSSTGADSASAGSSRNNETGIVHQASSQQQDVSSQGDSEHSQTAQEGGSSSSPDELLANEVRRRRLEKLAGAQPTGNN